MFLESFAGSLRAHGYSGRQAVTENIVRETCVEQTRRKVSTTRESHPAYSRHKAAGITSLRQGQTPPPLRNPIVGFCG